MPAGGAAAEVTGSEEESTLAAEVTTPCDPATSVDASGPGAEAPVRKGLAGSGGWTAGAKGLTAF